MATYIRTMCNVQLDGRVAESESWSIFVLYIVVRVGDYPPLISVAKWCDSDLHCLEFLMMTDSCRGLTVCLCEHGLYLRGTSRHDHAMYVAAGIAESGGDIITDVKR